MKEAILLDLPAAEYHASPGVSNSMLKHFKRSPAHLQHALREPHEPSAEMVLGTLTHSRILEPDKPLPLIAVEPETYPAPSDCSAVKQKKCQPGDPLPWHGAANYCKAWRHNMTAQGRIILSKSELENIDGMVNALAGNELSRAALGSGQGVSEVSIFKGFNLGGSVMRRLRLDFVHIGDCLVDVKTCDDARPEVFQSRAFDLGYFRQAAFYLDAFNEACREESLTADLPTEMLPFFKPKSHFVFVAIERKPPYGICVYQMSNEAMGHGRKEYMDLLASYIHCVISDDWPCYTQEVNMLELPGWMKRKEQFQSY